MRARDSGSWRELREVATVCCHRLLREDRVASLIGGATYGEPSLTLSVAPTIGRPIRYRGHVDRRAIALSFEMLGREWVAAASQQSRQSRIVRRSVLGQSAAF